MGREFHPVVPDHVLQRLVATQRSQPSLPGYILHIATNDIIESIFLKGSVLVPNHLEFPRYLPQQKPALDEFKGHVVKLEYFEVPLDKERVCIRF